MGDKEAPENLPMTRTEGEGATLDLPEGVSLFRPGQVLGDRYQILEMLGRGGIGEVWHAFDLKLRVEVALKALREDLFKDERRLELLRQEVRAAREVMSPNVCRIFDLVEAEGRELVSMEYIDGATLLDVLQNRGPLELKDAQEIASQFLAGLESIHQAGLVHRDVKPENIMMTRAGRVVVMDFGLARTEDSGAGTVAGTPAYMSPEQAAGLMVDARADVYSAGVVLAEMVCPEGINSFESRQGVWEGIRSEPVKIPDTAWAPVVTKAVAREREARYNSAHTLIRALEDRTFRVEGAEDLHPYPGLASFTEADAEYFFGREAEIEQIWRKLERPHLLGIVGPSGSGKSSFIRAGLMPSAEEGWAIATCTPGNAANASLRRALASEISDDSVAVGELAVGDPDSTVSAYSRWRARHDNVLLIVDQFEELFTLNPPDVQARFTELLGRLVLEADAFVLLSMRDDFFFLCHEFEALKPLVTDLTLLGPPAGAALRRALVQPAMKCGYRFEDDELVDEMLAEVESERGALPLLAFSMSRLWEKRDRDSGLLTRQAYHDIGGVGGALAQHAEATIDRVGPERIPIIRELFRNLVTAEGTRAVREWDELLSIFDGEPEHLSSRVKRPKAAESRDPPMHEEALTEGTLFKPGGDPSTRASDALAQDDRRQAASDVLRKLIDARLLTSYEVHEEEREPARRVEIIHESLLTNWPRLVRWQTQDQEGAQLRDELRLAARSWDEHGRHDDRLWTDTAFREYQLWRERFPGNLSEIEEAFASAMTSLAARRRRRRRTAIAAGFITLLAVLAIVGALWQRSVTEARRAEGANLFSLAQLSLEDHPSGAIAYAVASLELADNSEVRRLALEALWRGPAEIRLETQGPMSLSIGPDGRWLATPGPDIGYALWPSDGGPPTALEGSDVAMELRISPRGDLVAANMDKERQELGLWSFPEGRFLRSFSLGDLGQTYIFSFSPDGERLFTSTEIPAGELGKLEVRSWPVAGGAPDLLARLDLPAESLPAGSGIDPTGSRLCWADGPKVRIARLDGTTPLLASATSVEHERTVAGLTVDAQGRQLATSDRGGEIRIWSLERDPPELTHTFRGPGGFFASEILFDPSGSMLAQWGLLWDLTAPPDAGPLQLRTSVLPNHGLAFDPESRWLATAGRRSVSLWSLAHPFPQVLRGHEEELIDVRFSPDGTRLVSGAEDGSVRVWPLAGGSGKRSRILHQAEGVYDVPWRLGMAPDGSFAVAGSKTGRVRVLPLDGGPVRELAGFTDTIGGLAVGPRARFVAAGAGGHIQKEAIVRVWDLESEEVNVLDAGDGAEIERLEFTGDGDLWAVSGPKLRRWSLDGDSPRVLEEIDLSSSQYAGQKQHYLDPDDRQALLCNHGKHFIQSFDHLEIQELTSHERGWGILSGDGNVVVSIDWDKVRVGSATGEEAHWLLGHDGGVAHVDISPDGRWIATGGVDKTIRLWPMPDFSKPPIHNLPREELIAKLETLTNLRAVRDEESPSGWKIEVGPFPGWETVPTW